MSTACARVTTLTYSGDVTATQTVAAAQNPASPAVFELRNLPVGSNTIPVPADAATPVAVTIIPPPGNIWSITLKGLAGDTGVPLHLTDPSTISLAAGVASFVLTTGGSILGVRFLWS
jgi:hypothetical protein